MTDSLHELKTPWWLRPVYIFICLNLTMAFIALVLNDDSYTAWGTAKYFGIQEFGIVLIAVTAYTLGNTFGALTKPSLVWTDRSHLNLSFKATCLIAILAYPVWFGNGIIHGFSPDMLLAFFKGEAGISDEIKATFATIPGITTAAQFGVTAASIYPFLSSVSMLERWMLRILFALCLSRSILLSERLAIIELAIPLLVAITVRRFSDSPLSKRRRISFIEPLVLGSCLFFLFAFSEYFRSWQYRQDEYSSFWQFILSRFSAYYVTALNNGAILSEQIGILRFPFFSLLFLWYFPWLPNSLRYQTLFNRDPEVEFNDALRIYSSDEFNNGCGIFLTYVDFGFLGFIVHWILFAFITRILLRDYCRHSLVGQLFFPLFLIAVVESSRVLYITNTRAFPAIIGAFATLAVSRIRLR